MTDPLADFLDQAQRGEFNPLSLIQGEIRIHSVFLAPLTPALRDGIAQFLSDGSGPLAPTVAQIKAQGAEDAVAAARAMFAAARGMCVIVLTGTHGIATIPHLLASELSEEWIAQAVARLDAEVVGGERLPGLLRELRAQSAAGNQWPQLVAGHGDDGLLDYWLELTHACVAGADEQVLPQIRIRLGDLAYWCVAAVAALAQGRAIEGGDVEVLVRCQLLAGAIEQAGAGILVLAEAGEAGDPDAVIELLAAFVHGALAGAVEVQAAHWLAAHRERLDAALGAPYDLAQALFRLQVASGSAAPDLLATAQLLAQRNRKLMRQDLTREPIWTIRPELAGALLDTAQAATVLGRSPTFVAKRLAAGTIPNCRLDDQLRLPAAALATWRTVLDQHGLLDG
jgi:hypothetical protein